VRSSPPYISPNRTISSSGKVVSSIGTAMLKFEVFEKGTDTISPPVVVYPETTQISSQFIDYRLRRNVRDRLATRFRIPIFVMQP
jgi:hypothetical protein